MRRAGAGGVSLEWFAGELAAEHAGGEHHVPAAVAWVAGGFYRRPQPAAVGAVELVRADRAPGDARHRAGAEAGQPGDEVAHAPGREAQEDQQGQDPSEPGADEDAAHEGEHGRSCLEAPRGSRRGGAP